MDTHQMLIATGSEASKRVRRSFYFCCAALAALLCCLANPLRAQDLEDIQGGGIAGGIASAGPYRLQDTLGETCVGPAASADYSLQGGFWTMLALPPAAYSPTIGLSVGQSWGLGVGELLVRTWDADRDAISLVSCDTRSVQGGLITRTGDLLLYTPPPEFADTDSFAYMVLDSGGDLSQGVVTFVQMLAGGLPSLQIYDPVPTKDFFAAFFAGFPDATYTVEFTESLTPPHWQKLTNVTVPASLKSGLFTDSSPNAPARFYRIVAPAY